MDELFRLLLDTRIYRDLALVVLPLLAALLVYLYYRHRGYTTMMADILKYGVYCSVHQTINAGDTPDYFDADLYLSEPNNVRCTLKWFREEMRNECSRHGRVDRIAFVEKEDGPVGAITLKDLFTWSTRTPSVMIRPSRKGPALRVKFSHDGLTRTADNKGRALRESNAFVRDAHKESIVLVSDVATTGTTILESVDLIERSGGRVKAAFVLYDRQEASVADNGECISAEERLARRGIRLVSMIRSEDLKRATANDPKLRRIAGAKGLPYGESAQSAL